MKRDERLAVAAALNKENDPYLLPGTPILANMLGMKDAEILQRVEHDFVTIRATELGVRVLEGRSPAIGDFDLAHLCAIHRHLFQDVYEWAGKIRTIDITKGDSRFVSYASIKSSFTKIHNRLVSQKFLKGTRRTEFTRQAAIYFEEINGTHPFREGNGRAQETYFWLLARGAGFSLRWDRVTKDALDDALIDGRRSDVRAVFESVITGLLGDEEKRREQVAFQAMSAARRKS